MGATASCLVRVSKSMILCTSFLCPHCASQALPSAVVLPHGRPQSTTAAASTQRALRGKTGEGRGNREGTKRLKQKAYTYSTVTSTGFYDTGR